MSIARVSSFFGTSSMNSRSSVSSSIPLGCCLSTTDICLNSSRDFVHCSRKLRHRRVYHTESSPVSTSTHLPWTSQPLFLKATDEKGEASAFRLVQTHRFAKASRRSCETPRVVALRRFRISSHPTQNTPTTSTFAISSSILFTFCDKIKSSA